MSTGQTVRTWGSCCLGSSQLMQVSSLSSWVQEGRGYGGIVLREPTAQGVVSGGRGGGVRVRRGRGVAVRVVAWSLARPRWGWAAGWAVVLGSHLVASVWNRGHLLGVIVGVGVGWLGLWGVAPAPTVGSAQHGGCSVDRGVTWTVHFCYVLFLTTQNCSLCFIRFQVASL